MHVTRFNAATWKTCLCKTQDQTKKYKRKKNKSNYNSLQSQNIFLSFYFFSNCFLKTDIFCISECSRLLQYTLINFTEVKYSSPLTNIKACVRYFSLLLKEQYVSWLFQTKYFETKFNLQLLYLPTASRTFILS